MRNRDQRLAEFARSMRREPTEPEKRLWRYLSRSQLGGFKFRRQAALGSRIADFFCPAIGLIVEIDGHTHDREADERRDERLSQCGLSVFRVTNEDVMTNMEGVCEGILAKARSSPRRVNWRLPSPHPNPSPEGEGL